MAEEKEKPFSPPSVYTPGTSEPPPSYDGQPPQKDPLPPQQPYCSPPLQYQPAVALMPPPDRPSDHLGLSIFSIVCCCWPIGIIALLKSMESHSHYLAGRYIEAASSSRESLKYNKIAIAVGIIVNVVILVLVFASIVARVVIFLPD